METCSSCTLCGHEVGKVPDEFPDDVLLPLLVKDVVVVLQDDVLVLLGEHHGWVLQREGQLLYLQPPTCHIHFPWHTHSQLLHVSVCVCVSPHAVKAWNGVGSILALDDGFLVLPVPVLELSVELEGDDLCVTRVMVPGEVAVHTDHVHIGSLGPEDRRHDLNSSAVNGSQRRSGPFNVCLQSS